MNKSHSDQKTIQLSMILLFLALLVIYILLFSIKGDTFKESLEGNSIYTNEIENTKNNTTDNNKQIITYQTETENIIDEILNDNTNNNTEDTVVSNNTENANTINTGELNEYEALEAEVENNETTTQLDNEDDIYILSGTEKYFGPIKIIEKLGIKYQFALKDKKDIYYIYLGSYEYNFDELARLRSGNTYKMTEQSILENNLFGEEITFINLPDYQNQTVIILVKANGLTWLLQIDYAIYHESKNYLKSIFGY